MDYKKSLEDMDRVLSELIDENKKITIVVEGEKDIIALRKLGVLGKIISLNKGFNLIDFADYIAKNFKEIIILTDWDRRGGFLCHTLIRNLKGRVFCNTYFREFFAKNTTIKTVEGLPSWILTINQNLIRQKSFEG
jgi:5S rRNA maturation endonuclease (ribonuclease M5)